MKKVFVLGTLLFNLVILSAQVAGSVFDFSDADLREIIYAVSVAGATPISCDDTVQGRGSFRFSGGDFDTAFDAFLESQRLYVKKTDNLWTVSRIQINRLTYTGFEESFSLDVFDLNPRRIVEQISRDCGVSVTCDALPGTPVSIHSVQGSARDLLKVVAHEAGCELVEKPDSLHLAKLASAAPKVMGAGYVQISCNQEENNYSVAIKNASLEEVVEKIFFNSKENFCIPASGDSKIARLDISSCSLQELLDQICAQAGFSYFLEDNIWYFLPSKDKKEALLAKNFLWKKFPLKYSEPALVSSVAKTRWPQIKIIALEEEKSILCHIPKEILDDFESFVSECDVAKQTWLVKLQYIKAGDFFARIPPFVAASSLSQSGMSDSFFFTGTKEAYDKLMEQMPLVDRPVKRLRYDLMIVQFQDSKNSYWGSSFSSSLLKAGDRNAASAALGSVLSLNMDVVSAFGLKFASELQASINKNKAKVFADTTLHGVSGGTISFQNTNTYRYRDNNLDPETGKPVYSGVTREISSGLKLDIEGWVSGDGMISTKVTASVSHQGEDSSASSGNPPPTTEKLITTEVHGRSGESIILSGLVQEDENTQMQGVPLLSSIPVIGMLFQKKAKTLEKSQTVIYLVPHWEEESFSSVQKLNQEESLLWAL